MHAAYAHNTLPWLNVERSYEKMYLLKYLLIYSVKNTYKVVRSMLFMPPKIKRNWVRCEMVRGKMYTHKKQIKGISAILKLFFVKLVLIFFVFFSPNVLHLYVGYVFFFTQFLGSHLHLLVSFVRIIAYR